MTLPALPCKNRFTKGLPREEASCSPQERLHHVGYLLKMPFP
jgi:hypothetical protein